jgi:hypothetical protein
LPLILNNLVFHLSFILGEKSNLSYLHVFVVQLFIGEFLDPAKMAVLPSVVTLRLSVFASFAVNLTAFFL